VTLLCLTVWSSAWRHIANALVEHRSTRILGFRACHRQTVANLVLGLPGTSRSYRDGLREVQRPPPQPKEDGRIVSNRRYGGRDGRLRLSDRSYAVLGSESEQFSRRFSRLFFAALPFANHSSGYIQMCGKDCLTHCCPRSPIAFPKSSIRAAAPRPRRCRKSDFRVGDYPLGTQKTGPEHLEQPSSCITLLLAVFAPVPNARRKMICFAYELSSLPAVCGYCAVSATPSNALLPRSPTSPCLCGVF